MVAVARELAVELREGKKDLASYISHLKPVPTLDFEGSVFLAKEFERIKAGKPSIKFSSRRVKPSVPAENSEDIDGWKAVVDAAKIEVGYLQGRLLHLQLLKKYGKDAWTSHNELMSFSKDLLAKDFENAKIEINELNLSRKREHLSAGAHLSRLESRFWTLEQQSGAVEKAIADLKKRKVE